jgi:hypothetical protein
MSNLVFDFCDTARVAEEMPPEEQTITSMNGWDFAARPKVPYRRKFKVSLYGLRWYLNVAGTALDLTTNTKFNAGLLLDFYKTHRLWDSFLYNHEYLGQIRVRFNKPVQIPAGAAGGRIENVDIELVEHSPSY